MGKRIKYKLIFSSTGIVILLYACVDRIHFDVPTAQDQIVVEGYISDLTGPYTVKVSQGLDLDADSLIITPVQGAKITLLDDEGNSENFTELSPGVYNTSGVIQGQVGHSYHINIETEDGSVFESDPDKIKPVGEIKEIKYEFDARTKEESFGTFKADIFKILIDAMTLAGDDNFVRWRFHGTYKVFTYPELYYYISEEFPLKAPWPCSGYIVVPQGNNQPQPPGEGLLQKVAECSCCTCYVSEYEDIPQLSDGQLISGTEYANIQVAQVPINTETFYDKYLVEVDQMSLSRAAFQFFKLVRAQKEGAASLFQPPSGEIKGNVKSVNNKRSVVGLFWATSIKSKSISIPKSAVPYTLAPIKFTPYPCDTYFNNSTTVKPLLW